jgi:enoyl-CoA hydratase/carnithine racemase
MGDRPHIGTALADRVLTVTLDRPDRLNAFAGRMADTTGRVFDAAEALACGLVRSVHEPDALLPAAYVPAREIAGNTAPVSVYSSLP